MPPPTASSMVFALCLPVSAWDVCGSATGTRPVAMKLAVVSTIVSSTSMMSTNGITLSVSIGCSSMGNLPLELQHLGLAQQRIVGHHGHQRHDQTGSGGLQRQRKTNHDLAGLHRRIDAHGVKRQHDAENGAQQAD